MALPGFVATLVGIGLGRFAYAPVVPAMIADGWLDAADAAYLGAINLGGYLIGALATGWASKRFGVEPVVRWMLVATIASLAACALPFGFFWAVPFRFLAGATGAMLMILAPPVLIGRAPPDMRGRVGGLVFAGVGLGIILSGTLVPWLARFGASAAWAGLGVVGFLAIAFAWRAWASPPQGPTRRQAPAAGQDSRLGPLFLLLALGYGLDAVSFIPHSIMWGDYIARDLGRGIDQAGMFWMLFGIGAALGPVLYGRVADRITFTRALVAGYVIKAMAIALPLVSTGTLFLGLSSLIVGSLAPGISVLISGTALELLGAHRHEAAWRWLTVLFSVALTVGSWALSHLFAATHDYPLLLGVCALVSVGALAVTLLALAARRYLRFSA